MSEKWISGPYAAEDVFGEGVVDIVLGYEVPGEGNPIVLGAVFVPDDAGEIPETVGEAEAIAKLWAAAPAMYLCLEAITWKAARIENSNGLIEFCFEGIRMTVRDGDWASVVDHFGWDRIRNAIYVCGGPKAALAAVKESEVEG